MAQFIFQLGQTPDLSFIELVSLVGSKKVSRLDTYLSLIEFESTQEAEHLFNTCGGTVKVFQIIEQLPLETDQTTLIEKIVAYFQNNSGETKVSFGLAELGRDHLPKIEVSTIKNELTSLGIKARYIESSRHGLSASVLLHQSKVTEIGLIQTSQQIFLTKTIAVQNIDEWAKRDRQKPYADKKKGMLPPKVARMMVNIAPQASLIYDPFCGSGTILMEALLTGHNVIGSDLDETAVLGSIQNLEWLQDAYPQVKNKKISIFKKDVTQVTLADTKSQVDSIVTEPFLGRLRPQMSFLPRMFKGLKKTYLGAFKQWTTILKPGGYVVIVFPKVITPRTTFSCESLIDKLEKMGYISQFEPVVYSRPQAITQRELYLFKFEQKS